MTIIRLFPIGGDSCFGAVPLLFIVSLSFRIVRKRFLCSYYIHTEFTGKRLIIHAKNVNMKPCRDIDDIFLDFIKQENTNGINSENLWNA